jgi:uncharacterized protein YdeI (YjbR/CyaY-like superfamily)
MAMITDIEDFFTLGCGRCDRFATPDCSTRLWIKGLNDLRAICRATGMTEVVKWAHPVYMHADRNVCIFGAFRDGFRLTFMNAALMKDPAGILQRQGPNTLTPDMINFTHVDQVTERADIIRAYLAEAMGYAERGLKPPKVERELDLPDEMIEVMDADPELAEAFHRLTPGRQRSYMFHLNSAKTSATRFNRIDKFRPKIMAGKGADEY